MTFGERDTDGSRDDDEENDEGSHQHAGQHVHVVDSCVTAVHLASSTKQTAINHDV